MVTNRIKKALMSLMVIISLGASYAHDEMGESRIWSAINRVWIAVESVDEGLAPVKKGYDRSKVESSNWAFFTQISKESPFHYLSKLTPEKSQREDWFSVSPSISEFWCFASNLAILGVGIYDGDWHAILAGLMSGISHAIPTKFAHDLDRFGVAAVVMDCAWNYQAILNSPSTLACGLFAGAAHGADVILSRKYGRDIGPWSHVVWHLTAAYGLHDMNSVLLRK